MSKNINKLKYYFNIKINDKINTSIKAIAKDMIPNSINKIPTDNSNSYYNF